MNKKTIFLYLGLIVLIGSSLLAVRYALGVTLGGNLNFASLKAVNMGVPTDDADGATMAYVNSAVSAAGGGACYTGWNITTCGAGFSPMYVGYIATGWADLFTNITDFFCSAIQLNGVVPAGSRTQFSTEINKGVYLNSHRCVVCCK